MIDARGVEGCSIRRMLHYCLSRFQYASRSSVDTRNEMSDETDNLGCPCFVEADTAAAAVEVRESTNGRNVILNCYWDIGEPGLNRFQPGVVESLDMPPKRQRMSRIIGVCGEGWTGGRQ